MTTRKTRYKECCICRGTDTVKIEKEIYQKRGRYFKEYFTTQYQECGFCVNGFLTTRRYNKLMKYFGLQGVDKKQYGI